MNTLNAGSARLFYEDSTKSKLTMSFNGIVEDDEMMIPLLQLNNDGRSLTASFVGKQIVNGGTNTLLTFFTSERVSSLDKVLITNSNSSLSPLEFRDLPCANRIKVDVFNTGAWEHDLWDYYITVGVDGGVTQFGYEAGAYGASEFDHNRKDATQIKQFTFDSSANEFIVEPKGGKQIFGRTCRLSMEGMPKATIPIDLVWDEANKNYSASDINYSFFLDEFTLLNGARMGFSLSARN